MQIFITIGDIVGVVLFLIVMGILFSMTIWRAIRQAWCSHTDTRITPMRDVVCRKCGKRLGLADALAQPRKNANELYAAVDPNGDLTISSAPVRESAMRHMTAH